MKTTTALRLAKRAAFLLLISILNPQPSTFAQGTAFTYQGRLNDGANPANGVYDLSFTLFNAASGGVELANSFVGDLGITNGLFTVALDFGAGVFTGAERWLEIAVQTNGAALFTTVSPRQPLTATPYAIYAGGVTASGISGTIAPVNIGAGSLTSVMLAAGAVGSNQLAAGAVTTGKLADGAVTAPKMATVSNWFTVTFPNPTPVADDFFGYSLAAVGSDRVLIGAYQDDTGAGNAGAAYLFNANGTLLTTFANPFPAAFDFFGYSVAAVGSDRVLIGAYGADTGAADVGAAYLFNTNGALLTNFINPTPVLNDRFGWAVAALGSDRVIIGAFGDDTGATDAGAAYLFNLNGALLTTLTNPTPAATDFFGIAVAAVGSDRVLVGAYGDNTGASDAGAAYLFSTNGTLLTTFTNPTPAANDFFGWSVAAVGSGRVLIGSYNDSSGGVNAGAAYLFSTNGTLLTTFTNPTPVAGDHFGISVAALGSDRVLIGARLDDTGASDAGAAYLFNTNGALLATFTNPTPGDRDLFGHTVAGLGNDRVLIGAHQDDTGAASAGVAYLFSAESFTPGLVAEAVRAGSVTTTSLADGAVTTTSLADGAVTAAKIGGVLQAGQIPNLDASKIAGGTLADARLSTNVALRNGGNAFTGNQTIAGSVVVDQNSQNNGNVSSSSLTFGSVSGEGIASKRTAGGNQWGLDFYTFFLPRLTIANNGNVGIGTTQPSARLSLVAPGASELGGTARSATLLTSSGGLGTVAGNELALATFGFASANSSSLGIRALRVANGSGWPDTAIGLGMDVDNTVRAGASLWLHANGNVGIGTTSPSTKLEVNGTVSAAGFSGNAGAPLMLGTTDDQPLEFKVNGTRALRLEYADNGVFSSVNVIGGSAHNFVAAGAVGATIGGGGSSDSGGGPAYTNKVTGNFGTVGGGLGNASVGNYSTVGGGYQNTSRGFASTVGGGYNNGFDANDAAYGTIGGGGFNTIQTEAVGATIGGGHTNTIGAYAFYATVGGGEQNTIELAALHSTIGGGAENRIQTNSHYATIGGGYRNQATNHYATVAGGAGNTAGGQFSFAAGHDAKALHDGTFVWADSPAGGFNSTGNDQFLIRAAGGVGINTNNPNGAGLAVHGTVTATVFSGSGANLTSLNGANISIGSVPGTLPWQTVGGVTQAAQANMGYVANSADQVTFTLPAAPNVGDIVRVCGAGVGGWRVKANTGQSIVGYPLAGASWAEHENNRGWQSVASSADGSKLVAAVHAGQIFLSTDSGVSWVPRESNRGWKSVASSADGSKLVAVEYGGMIYTSSDSGMSWLPRASIRFWRSVASSADGTKLVAVGGPAGGDQIYTSTDSGVSWTPRESNRSWTSVASSADGSKLVAAVANGLIYTYPPLVTEITGVQGTTAELQYVGNGQWLPANMATGSRQRLTGAGGEGTRVMLDLATYPPERYGVSDPSAQIRATDTNYSGDLDFLTKQPGAAENPLVSRLHITSSGNVGIGTTTPGCALQVIGNVSATSFLPCSDRNLKENFTTVNPREVLEKVAGMTISRWNFKGDTATPHVGPMAQDFHAAFGLGTDDKHIATVDADGVALAAIQGLNQKVETGSQKSEVRIQKLESQNAELKRELTEIKQLLLQLSDKRN